MWNILDHNPYSVRTEYVEKCNGLDDDCNKLVDELSTVASEGCGTCGNICAAGSSCTGSGVTARCREIECADGIDNDADGETDCAEADCAGKLCTNQLDHRESYCRGGTCVLNVEDCDNGVDDDLDGTTDCGDASCSGAPCASGRKCVFLNSGSGLCALYEQSCGNGVDDDSDGEADCGDPDCDQQPCANDAGTCSSGFCL